MPWGDVTGSHRALTAATESAGALPPTPDICPALRASPVVEQTRADPRPAHTPGDERRGRRFLGAAGGEAQPFRWYCHHRGGLLRELVTVG